MSFCSWEIQNCPDLINLRMRMLWEMISSLAEVSIKIFTPHGLFTEPVILESYQVGHAWFFLDKFMLTILNHFLCMKMLSSTFLGTNGHRLACVSLNPLSCPS